MWRNTRFWTFSRAISILASLSWMSWKSPIGVPHRTRSLAYCTESFRHSSMTPRDMAATPARSVTKLDLADSRPAPPPCSCLAEEVVPADPHVGQEELAGRGGVEAHLAQGLRLLEARGSRVEDEGEHRAVAHRGVRAVVELGVEHDGVGVGAVGDPGLRAVDDVLVAVPAGHGGHAAQRVRPGVGLGDGPGADLLGGQQVEAPPLHLGRGAALHDGAGGQADAHPHRGHDARAVVAQLDDRDEGHGRRPAVTGPVRPLLRRLDGAADLALELLLEPVAGHLVHAEGGVQLADDVVGGESLVLEGVDVRAPPRRR